MKRWLPLLAVLLSACNFNEVQEDMSEPTEGYTPLYASREAADIRLLAPQTVKNPGKIYVYQNYLLVNERNRGIHVFDNSDKANPVPLAFAEIVGNSDMAIKNDVLFADHMGNLAALKIIDQFNNLEQTGSLPINEWLLGVPPPQGAYFECIDQANGVVVDWKESIIPNKNCYASASRVF
jgi:hypothetical protein